MTELGEDANEPQLFIFFATFEERMKVLVPVLGAGAGVGKDGYRGRGWVVVAVVTTGGVEGWVDRVDGWMVIGQGRQTNESKK